MREFSMFRCTQCGSQAFRIEVQAQYRDQLKVYVNEHQETVIQVGEREIIADLMFMNQYALCEGCNGIRQWEYYFPGHSTPE